MWNCAATPGALGKRKDREPSDGLSTQSSQPKAEPRQPEVEAAAAARGKDNRLLAGLLAHEFLMRGTLCRKMWEPERGGAGPGPGPGPAKPGRPVLYAEVSYLLKSDRAHIPGIVNPTQLARWLQM